MASRAAFNVKGMVYRGTREFYDRRIPGGLAVLRREIADPDLLRFWEQPFTAAGWYDLYPLMAINQAASRVIGIPYTELVTENAAYIADRDIHGVYRLLFKLATPELVVAKLPRASLQYLDFGEGEGRLVGPRHFLASQLRVPAAFASWMTASVQGFAPTALMIAGARNVRIETRRVRREAQLSEARTVDLFYDIRWG